MESSHCPMAVLLIGVLALWEDRGDAIHMREVATALQERHINPVVLCLPGPPAPDQATVPEIRVSPWRKRFMFQLSWNLLGTIAAIKAVRTHSASAIYSRLDPGMVVGLLAAIFTGKPLVVEMNGLPSEDLRLYRPHNQILLYMTRAWESMMYRAARAIVGAPGYAEYVQTHFGVSQEKLCIVPLGVNTGLFYPRDRKTCCMSLGISEAPTIAWAGNLVGWQGLPTLIKAISLVRQQVPDVKVLLVGDGPARRECERLIESEGLQETFWITGRVPYERMPEYLGCASVCVATFPGNRGSKGTISALKTLTYLACGRPVITTLMDEMSGSIQDAGAGYAVPPDDPAILANRLSDILTEPQHIWTMRCQKAVTLIGYKRSWGAATDRIASLLRSIAI